MKRHQGGFLERDRAEDDFLGKQFCSVAAGVAAAGIAGAAISANGAKSAAGQQSAAADRATMLQMQAQAQQRSDLSPWVQSGVGANSALNRYLGIGGPTGASSAGLSYGLSPDQVRQQLLSQYTKTTGSSSSGGPVQYASGQAAIDALGPLGAYNYFLQNSDSGPQTLQGNPAANGAPGYWGTKYGSEGAEWIPMTPGQASQGGGSTVDEEGLNAAIQKYYQEQEAQNSALQSDPAYGSLLRPFHNGEEFDPGPAFSFTGENLASDPGYQFGLNQGTQGIDRGQASRGNYLSGAAMKELTRFNEDYAGTKFNDAFSRASSTYGTNLAAKQNAWNTNLGAYTNNQDRVYNFLTGVSTIGQNSAARVGAGNQQAANNISGNMLASGAAQSAGTVASSNALASGLNQAANTFNSSNNLNSAAGWNNLLANQGGGYSGYTGYTGGANDPIANLNAQNKWTG